MNYYIKELYVSEGIQKTAGVKARDDVNYILSEIGFKDLTIISGMTDRSKKRFWQKLKSHIMVYKYWNKALRGKKAGDRIVIQFPCVEHSLFLANILKIIVSQGIEVILLVHDLELMRNAKRTDVSIIKRMRMKIEEYSVLQQANKIIAHNAKMKEYLVGLGIEESKIVILEIFDYLINNFSSKENHRYLDTLIIAGNLRYHKAQYVYHLPEQIKVNLYGVGYEGKIKENISYKGAFLPEELSEVMEGGFGIVWDGISSENCIGVYGEYLKLNNPHKMSLYLANEIPVIVWKQAALAKFVEENNCGILVESLYDIKMILQNMTKDEYDILKQGARNIGDKMRSGVYLKRAIEKCMN